MLLLFDAYTRSVSLLLVPVLLGATWAHSANGWLFTAPNGGWEYPAFLTLAGAVVALVGAGRYSIDGQRQTIMRPIAPRMRTA